MLPLFMALFNTATGTVRGAFCPLRAMHIGMDRDEYYTVETTSIFINKADK